MVSRDSTADRYLEKAIKISIVMLVIVVLLMLTFYGIDKYRAWKHTPITNRIITQLENRVRNNPRDLRLRVVLGEAYLKNGQYNEAMTQFKQVLKIDSNYEDAILDLGIAYMKQGKLLKAEDQFKTEIAMNELSQYKKMNKRLESALYYLAACQFRRHKYQDAIINSKKALLINPTSSDTFLLMGRISLDKKDYKQAVGFFTKAMTFDPKFVDAYYGRGLAFEQLKQKDKARTDFSRVLTMAPDFGDAKEALERVK